MSAPTIDEMLVLLDAAFEHLIGSDLYVDEHYDGTLDRTSKAIRAILEQHRDRRKLYEMEVANVRAIMDLTQVEVIRAFVERVEKRWREYDVASLPDPWDHAIHDELAAMEKESQPKS